MNGDYQRLLLPDLVRSVVDEALDTPPLLHPVVVASPDQNLSKQGVKSFFLPIKEAAKKVIFFSGPGQDGAGWGVARPLRKITFFNVRKKVHNGRRRGGGTGFSGRITKKITFFAASLREAAFFVVNFRPIKTSAP